ncbi:hypothetical protein [Paracoccus sp. PAR01]|uniref:hypothetical protein n=1 Tax=Paracoccus sp. PAR01 TaxID=2769282 RepID=UPI001782041A|nr:hypothetical protein [Paracoccus sp. PAR01]MBD9527843.1 hypothetical protein [Paracoccus sp. PAR01]
MPKSIVRTNWGGMGEPSKRPRKPLLPGQGDFARMAARQSHYLLRAVDWSELDDWPQDELAEAARRSAQTGDRIAILVQKQPNGPPRRRLVTVPGDMLARADRLSELEKQQIAIERVVA